MRRLTLWTWNVNGLDELRLDERSEAACFTVLLRPDPPDVLLLQEVVRRSWYAHWRPHLTAAGYAVIPADPATSRSEYFALVAVRTALGAHTGSAVPFPTSGMGRSLVHVEVGGWWIGTGHLESGRSASAERIGQLAAVCADLHGAAGPAVFGGDTNLRVEEEARVPGLAGLTDAWQACGSVSADRSTWLGGKKGARFDRVLCNRHVRPTSFRRVGVDPLPELGPISDHTALVVELETVGG